MTKELYVTDEGFSIDVAESYAYRGEGLACLVIQSSEDRDIHLSEIRTCSDFSVSDPETTFEFRGWIYSLYQESDDAVYVAHSGKVLRYGPHDEPEPVLEVTADITKLCASSSGVWIVGLDAYVAHFDGTTLKELPLPDVEKIFTVSEAKDGTVFAAGAAGALFRLDGNQWVRIELGLGQDIFRLVAKSKDELLLAGELGLCGHYRGEQLQLFEADAEVNFRAIAEFKGKVYVGAGHLGLYLVEDGEVIEFKDNIYTFHLQATEDYLVAAGFNEIARFDGDSWLAAEFT